MNQHKRSPEPQDSRESSRTDPAKLRLWHYRPSPGGGFSSQSAGIHVAQKPVPPPRSSVPPRLESHDDRLPALRRPRSARFNADHAAVVIVILLFIALVAALVLDHSPRSSPVSTSGNPNASVWINTSTGLYFCRGEKHYGTGKGKYMTQREAQRNAFRSASRTPCR